MPKPKRRPSSELSSVLLDLHEPIARVRPIAELVNCLADSRDGAPPSVLGIVGRLLYMVDADLRARYAAVQAVQQK